MHGSDYVIIEVGFVVEIGVEKFFDIKCCVFGLCLDVVVVVVIVCVFKV